MNISISQNFKNVLKNKIKILISPILYKSIDFIIDNLFEINNPDKYFYFMNTIQSSVKELIKNIVITSFEELDNNFKNSNNRTSRYIINKSNVSRTIITIVGEITFSRTYYINKFSGDKFFYVDNCFDLPKYDHYDPIIKAIAINNAVNTSQAQSARDTMFLMSFLNLLILLILFILWLMKNILVLKILIKTSWLNPSLLLKMLKLLVKIVVLLLTDLFSLAMILMLGLYF